MSALRTRSLVLVAALGALAIEGCKRRSEVETPKPADPPAIRAASSFVHCVEVGKAQCVRAEQTSTGWNALYLLAWLGSGSPLAILDGLPNELAAHGRARAIQVRFVEEVERYAPAMRGAECDALRAEPFTSLINDAARDAATRLEKLGLLGGGMQTTVERLVEDAHAELDGGHLVHMTCAHDPFRLYLAVRTEQGERQTVVGMTTVWPESLGGHSLEKQSVEERLQSQELGLATAAAPVVHNALHRWLPFSVEEF